MNGGGAVSFLGVLVTLNVTTFNFSQIVDNRCALDQVLQSICHVDGLESISKTKLFVERTKTKKARPFYEQFPLLNSLALTKHLSYKLFL